MKDALALNKLNWNERAHVHRHDPEDWYGVQRFLAGESVLTPIERAALGDLSGLKVLHLQCHIGLDTLSMARTAEAVVGVDFSDAALAHAHDLAEQSGLSHKVRFLLSDALAAGPLLDTDFDLAFASWGATPWLPDIFAWAQVMAGALKPGGLLYYIDGHPVTASLEQRDGTLMPTYDYWTPRDQPIENDCETSYNGSPTKLHHSVSMEWNHPLSSFFAALAQAGLRLETFDEHEALPWQAFPMMVQDAQDRQYRLPAGHPRLPLAFSFQARKHGQAHDGQKS